MDLLDHINKLISQHEQDLISIEKYFVNVLNPDHDFQERMKQHYKKYLQRELSILKQVREQTERLLNE